MTGESITLTELDRARDKLGGAVLLEITDRCPVGCAHCSVDSTLRGPSISDRALFREIVGTVAADPRYSVVGISGGEPFVERWGLETAVAVLAAAGKQLVVYTSAYWATDDHPPPWIRRIFNTVGTVVLSSDVFHQRTVGISALKRAVSLFEESDTWPIVQYVAPDGEEGNVEARDFMNALFGSDWGRRAELRTIPLIEEGRARKHRLVNRRPARPGSTFGSCHSVSPTIRYDGRAAACCNSDLLRGQGPERLRAYASSSNELAHYLRSWSEDPWLRFTARTGLGPLTNHPDAGSVGSDGFATPCELCWELHRRVDTQTPFSRAFVGILAPSDDARAPLVASNASSEKPT